MKKIYFLFACLTIATIACGTQMPTQPSTEVKATPTDLQVSYAAIAEPTDTPPQYMTTGALNVRAEPNADSEILGTLAPFTEVTVFILDVTGDDCYMGEWYAISSPIEGYVCSLWVVRK